MNRMILLLVLCLGVLLLAACAPGVNEFENTANNEGQVAGFWIGAWQGFISPFSFLASLFVENVTVYEVHNNGNWYNFGFLFGASAFFGGSGGGAARKRHK